MAWYDPTSWFIASNTTQQDHSYFDIEMQTATKSGANVSVKTALTVPVVWACVRLISNTIATLPIKLYETKDGQKTEHTGLNRFLLKKVNGFMTIGVFLETAIVSLLLKGNFYALINRNGKGEVTGFTPMVDGQVTPHILDGDLIYKMRISSGNDTLVSPENMLHFKIFSLDGICGLSLIEYLSETVGLLTTARDFSAYSLANGGFTGGLVVFDQFLTNVQREGVKARFQTIKQNGVQDVSKLVVLEGGAKFTPRTTSQKDAQFIESRSFDVVEFCGAIGVPPSMIGQTNGTSNFGTGIEQQNIGFVTYCLRYYITRIEEELNDKVFSKMSGDFRCEFIVNGLLRGDSAARASYYTAAVGGSAGSGWMSTNEVRKLENLPPIEDGDEVTTWSMNNE
jgi:HK97 family phage portal protein